MKNATPQQAMLKRQQQLHAYCQPVPHSVEEERLESFHSNDIDKP